MHCCRLAKLRNKNNWKHFRVNWKQYRYVGYDNRRAILRDQQKWDGSNEARSNWKGKTTPTYKDKSGKIVYNKAEVDPSFTGGNNEMKKYLRDNLNYPKQAEDDGIEGTVFVDFVVDDRGSVREVTASDVVGEDVDLMLKNEAVRVVASMPAWVPGTQRGKAVDTRFSIPITFQLNWP